MATPVTDPAILEQLNGGGKKPVTDPALLSQLNGGEAGPQFKLSDAVTDIPREIGKTADANLTTIEQSFSNRGSKGPIEGILSTGRGLMALPGLLASPFTGAVRSLVGHPMAQATHEVGKIIAPEIAAKDDPQKMYEAAAGDVETSLLAGKPGTKSVPKVAVPTIKELKDSSRAGYASPEVAAVEIKPQATANLSAKIENDLVQKGFRPAREGAVFDEVKSLVPDPAVQSVKVADIHSAQKSLGIMAREKDAVGQATPRAAAATVAKEHIEDFLPSISQADVLAGDAAKAADILKQAGADWGAAKRAEAIDLQLTRADRQAAKSGSGGNIENSMRQKIATLLDNPKRTSGFSDAEKAAMETIVRGSPTRNALRKAGKLGVGDGLSLSLSTGAALGTGGASIPYSLAATGARKIGEALTAKSGRELSEMIRSRSSLGNSRRGLAAVQQALLPSPSKSNAALPYAALVSALLAAPQRR